MNPPELVLHHQRLDQRAGHLRAQIERLRAQLASDPEADALEARLAEAQGDRRSADLQLRERERESESRRTRLRGREKEMMSGRVRNPTELMKMNEEVQHLKVALGQEDDATLELMERQETLEADIARLTGELSAARERTAAAVPDLTSRLERFEGELTEVEAERDATWEQVPPQWQEAYRRLRSRHPDPVARVANNQCQACHVAVTSSGMQTLRRTALVLCENCGRLLVAA